MEEVFKLGIGIFILLLGIPIGMFIARLTNEELDSGKKWFKVLIGVALGFSLIGLFIRSDALLFSCLFIAIVTSMSLRKAN